MAQLELPKLSALTQVLATPETMFENMVKSSLGIELPPGPHSTLLKLQTSIEAGSIPSPETIIPKRVENVLSKIPLVPKLLGDESELSPAERKTETRPPTVKFELV